MNYNKIIQEKGLKKIHIAKQLGISPAMLSLFLHNKRSFSYDREIQLRRVLGMNR